MKQFCYIACALALVPVCLLAFTYERDLRRWARPPPDKSIAEAYALHEFEPKYRRAECIVGIEQRSHPEKGSGLQDVPSAEISRYVIENEPRAVLYSYMGQPRGHDHYMIFIQFSDQCERRFEIAKGIADHVNYWFPGVYDLKASDKLFLPGPNIILSYGKASWIDG